MGVFAMFRRKSKGTEGASTAEAQAATLTAEPEAEDSSQTSEAADTPAAAEAAEPEASTEAADTPEAAAEPVEIPKQQSAEQAADSEAGEGAHK
jgi:hypothetical protein